jgi:hypothetical protein
MMMTSPCYYKLVYMLSLNVYLCFKLEWFRIWGIRGFRGTLNREVFFILLEEPFDLFMKVTESHF